jgi:hypothetical protein
MERLVLEIFRGGEVVWFGLGVLRRVVSVGVLEN